MKLVLCLICISIASANDITCSFKAASFGKLNINYKCVATEIEVHSPGIQLTGILGTHAVGKTNNDIGILIIQNKTVHYLLHNMQLYLPNLYHLDLDNTGLKRIGKIHMKMFPKLKYLYIRNCKVEVLPSNLFDNNKQLQFINLNDNRIKHVAASVFDAPIQLVSLSMERNVCVNNSAMGDEMIAILKQEITLQCSLSCGT